MKTFVLEITIREGNDEFREGLKNHPDLGIAEVKALVAQQLEEVGWYDGEEIDNNLKSFIYIFI